MSGTNFDVGIDESNKTLVLLNDKRLAHVGKIVDALLNLLGIYVLSRRTENHVLATTANEEEAIVIDSAEVAGVEPAVLESSGSCFGILVVSEHHIVALHAKFACNVAGVGRVDFGSHAVHDTSARLLFVLIPGRVGDERSTLGHSVTHGVGELDAAQEFLHVLVECSATHDNLYEVSAESCGEAFLDFAEQTAVDERHHEHKLHERLVEQREHLVLDDFLYDKRNGDD